MFLSMRCLAIVSVVILPLGFAGCGGNSTIGPGASEGLEIGGRQATGATGHGHVHPSEGPHGGSLVELGKEEYHAELAHDDAAGTVTIYVLDSAAKSSVPIDATEVTVNLKHDGRGEQFKLAASAAPGDPAGKSSRFVSSDAELGEDLDREGAEPQLVITINGKQYRGAIDHDHDHEEGHHHEHE